MITEYRIRDRRLEPARLETEPGRLALIFKFLFKVTSMGLFLFRDRLVLALPEDVSMRSDKYFKQVSGIREVFLKLIYNSIFHFMGHLKVIGMISEELETKITYSLENKHLINMFAPEKSLAYYVDAVTADTGVIERLRHAAGKAGFLQRSIEFMDDITIKNQQCYRQASIYSNVFASLVGARSSVISNNPDILMKSLSVVVIAAAVPRLFSGMGGMSELYATTGIHGPEVAYPVFLFAMLLLGWIAFIPINRLEEH